MGALQGAQRALKKFPTQERRVYTGFTKYLKSSIMESCEPPGEDTITPQLEMY